jgi:hypothetical protein
MKPNLNNVTLVCIDCVSYGEAISALRKSLYQCDFAKAIFLTDIKAYNPNFPFEIIKIGKIGSKEEYSRFVIKELYKHIETDYVLLIQHDGYVLNGESWDDEFFKYDYIGAPWLYTDGKNVGNGGFSFRSRKLLTVLGQDDFIQATDPEDQAIGRLYRDYLIKTHGIEFAPEALADKFSFELREPICKTFGFHGNFHKPFRETVIIKRTGALGDVVAIEPVLEYFHNKGCKVVIDVPMHLALIYSQHHFPVHHISQITDKRVPLTVIDLDGSYEEKPKQLHLQSYYEAAGITDGIIKNPKLNFPVGDHNRLFKKYFVLHADKRDQAYRNIYGVNFEEVVAYLNSKGFNVIQVGKTEHEEVKGAIQFNTVTTNMLLYLCAGASGFIGIDSGVAAISVACNVPSAIFFGSVDAEVIHPDLSNIHVIEHDNVCDTPKCWGDVVGGLTGKECAVDASKPPCTAFTTQMAIDALNKML